jgi:hypothetical protein
MACRAPRAPTAKDIPYNHRGIVLQKTRELRTWKTVSALYASILFGVFCINLQQIKNHIGSYFYEPLTPTSLLRNKFSQRRALKKKYHTKKLDALLQKKPTIKQPLENRKPTKKTNKVYFYNTR